MSADDHAMPDIADESLADSDSLEERRARNRAKLDAARERARQTIEASRERRRRRLEAWACIGDFAAEVVLAAARERAYEGGLSVEEAFCMIQGESQTKH